MPRLSLLVPACNEENSIEQVLNDHLDLLIELKSDNLLDDYEIIVLDDGSQDSTYSLVAEIMKRSEKIRLIRNERPSGLQSAFNQLYQCANFEWMLLTPGDGQWPATGVRLMIQAAERHNWTKGVLSFRKNKFKTYTPYRFVISILFRFYAYCVLREDIKDPGSIKLLPKEISHDKYKTTSVVREVERLQRFIVKGSENFVSIEVPWGKRSSGRASGASINTLSLVIKDFYRLFGN